MKLGDVVSVRTKGTDEETGRSKIVEREGEVVYIHPQGRFFTLAFKSKGGSSYRETFYKRIAAAMQPKPIAGRPSDIFALGCFLKEKAVSYGNS